MDPTQTPQPGDLAQNSANNSGALPPQEVSVPISQQAATPVTSQPFPGASVATQTFAPQPQAVNPPSTFSQSPELTQASSQSLPQQPIPQPQAVQVPNPQAPSSQPIDTASFSPSVTAPTQPAVFTPMQPQNVQPQPTQSMPAFMQQPQGQTQQQMPASNQTVDTQVPMQAMQGQMPQTPVAAAIPQIPKNLRLPSAKLSLMMTIFFIILSFSMVGFSYRVLAIRKKEGAKVAAIETPSKTVREERKKVGNEVQDRSDGTLDLSSTFDPSQAAFDQDIKAKQNQQVNLSNGLSFMVTGVSPWASTSKYTKPADGKKFVQVTFLIGNRSTKRMDSYVFSGFGIKEGDGRVRDDAKVSLFGDDEAAFPADMAVIGSGGDGVDSQKSTKAVAVFEVSNSQAITLVYSDSPSGKLPGEKDEDYPSYQAMSVKVEIPL